MINKRFIESKLIETFKSFLKRLFSLKELLTRFLDMNMVTIKSVENVTIKINGIIIKLNKSIQVTVCWFSSLLKKQKVSVELVLDVIKVSKESGTFI